MEQLKRDIINFIKNVPYLIAHVFSLLMLYESLHRLLEAPWKLVDHPCTPGSPKDGLCMATAAVIPVYATICELIFRSARNEYGPSGSFTYKSFIFTLVYSVLVSYTMIGILGASYLNNMRNYMVYFIITFVMEHAKTISSQRLDNSYASGLYVLITWIMVSQP